jgi:hypothetical protein
MLLGKQSDVKKHLTSLHHTKIHLIPAVGLPDATETSLIGPEANTTKSTAFAKDYSADHTTSEPSKMPVADSTDFIGTQLRKAAENVQP